MLLNNILFEKFHNKQQPQSVVVPPPLQQRRRTAVLPKRNWIQRNPMKFQITFITVSLLTLFSKQIYDGFFAEQLPPPPGSALSRRR